MVKSEAKKTQKFTQIKPTCLLMRVVMMFKYGNDSASLHRLINQKICDKKFVNLFLIIFLSIVIFLQDAKNYNIASLRNLKPDTKTRT